MNQATNRDRIAGPTLPKIALRVVNDQGLLTTAAAEQLVTRLQRWVTALESLLIALEHKHDQDAKCLADILTNDLKSEVCMLQEQLSRFRAKQPAGRR